MKWPGAPLVLYISTDYDGTSNPTLQGTWTDITSQALWDVDNTTWGNWTNSGDVDLSAYKSSSTYIAYEYFGSSSSGSTCLLYTSPSPRDRSSSRMPSSA